MSIQSTKSAIARLLGLVIGAALFSGSVSAADDSVIRIGELNSYKAQPAFLEPYRKGWQLALEEVNAAGGVGGHKLEVVSRDDNASPSDAVRVADELVSQDGVAAIFGGYLSNVGLALTDHAAQRKVVYLAAEPLTDKIVWQQGNRYTYRLRPSTYMQVAMLVPRAAQLHLRRWALVYPNYEYGQSAVATFKQLLKAAQPDVEFVTEQASPLGKVDAGSVAQAIDDAKPDGIFNVLFGTDLGRFVREGQVRGVFEHRAVVSLLTGEPEYLDPLGSEAPVGWIVTGYPGEADHGAPNERFIAAYRKRFGEPPKMGSVVGYTALIAMTEALRKSHGQGGDALADAFSGLSTGSPFGPIRFRPQDHQSTMGAFVGTTALAQGKGVMQSFVYIDGASVQPSDAEVARLRPGS